MSSFFLVCIGWFDHVIKSNSYYTADNYHHLNALCPEHTSAVDLLYIRTLRIYYLGLLSKEKFPDKLCNCFMVALQSGYDEATQS